MASMSMAEIWARVDVLGEEIVALTEPGNDAVRQAKEMELFVLLYKISPAQKTRDAISDFYMSNFKDYNPEKGKFSSYLRTHLKFRELDQLYMDATYQTVRETDPNTGKEIRRKMRVDSLDVSVGGGSSCGTERFKLLEDENAWLPFDEVESDHGNARLLQLASLMLGLPEKLRGKANNPIRIMYFHLFYTAAITRFLKEDPIGAEIYGRHERDMFHAMTLPFLYYYMAEVCRTVVKIACGQLKLYGELVEGRPREQETKLPLPDDVYLAYLEKVVGYQAKRAALSQQRTLFHEFLRMELFDS